MWGSDGSVFAQMHVHVYAHVITLTYLNVLSRLSRLLLTSSTSFERLKIRYPSHDTRAHHQALHVGSTCKLNSA
jgi:hypothetical protein